MSLKGSSSSWSNSLKIQNKDKQQFWKIKFTIWMVFYNQEIYFKSLYVMNKLWIQWEAVHQISQELTRITRESSHINIRAKIIEIAQLKIKFFNPNNTPEIQATAKDLSDRFHKKY
jgi:hypothetical protein